MEDRDHDAPDLDPYLVQVLAADQSEESIKAGQGPRDFLIRAGTSTQGLLGAKPQKPISIVNGSTPQSGAGQ